MWSNNISVLLLVVSSLTRLVASIDRKIGGIRLLALSNRHVPLWIAAAGALCAFVNEDSDVPETAGQELAAPLVDHLVQGRHEEFRQRCRQGF
jgi:hypothetical protein